MNLPRLLTLILLLAGLFISTGLAQSRVDEVQPLMDSAYAVEANIFAPSDFEKTEKLFRELKTAVAEGKTERKIDKVYEDCRAMAENIIKATEVTKITLSEYLDARDRAKAADAPTLVPELYNTAEEQFVKATKKVEDGNTKSGLKEAEAAGPLFNTAELEAIKVQIIGEAGKLIEKATADDAKKYAPTSLDKARTSLTKGEAILVKDRYERNESVKSAKQSEYEARHASSIAQTVRSMERNDQAWERLMLLYEIEIQKIGNELAIEQVPFDNGPIGAAKFISDSINAMKNSYAELKAKNEKLMADLSTTLAKLNVNTDSNDPSDQLMAIQNKYANLTSKLDSSKAVLTNLESTHERISKELGARQEKEQKIENARSILNPTEGEVLLNATDDIVVRLFGLSFAPNSSDISDNHVDLLTKVKSILEIFPNTKLLVEGHTDDQGERTTNMRLSEKRAFSVMQYLRKLMSIPADRIDAVGYGPDKPIGTNTTKEGRAKNRRIDILIFQ
ncbi:MAG: OmpA family protein [Candidatus Zixiibacteriota bacterium]